MSAGHPDLDRALRFLRRRLRRAQQDSDYGPLCGMAEIRQAVGCGKPADKDYVRGLLVKLVAQGVVEPFEGTSGVFWLATGAPTEAEFRAAERDRLERHWIACRDNATRAQEAERAAYRALNEHIDA